MFCLFVNALCEWNVTMTNSYVHLNVAGRKNLLVSISISSRRNTKCDPCVVGRWRWSGMALEKRWLCRVKSWRTRRSSPRWALTWPAPRPSKRPGPPWERKSLGECAKTFHLANVFVHLEYIEERVLCVDWPLSHSEITLTLCSWAGSLHSCRMLFWIGDCNLL